jgi:endogenous inhibitor of DNA gyrase (YacG/DUF329 family)
MPVEVNCTTCGDTVERIPSKADGNNFCSRDCYHEWKRTDWEPESGKVAVECEQCGDDFQVYPYREDSARFCSRECKDNHMKGKSGAGTPAFSGAKEEYECDNCGATFKTYPYHDTAHCSDECYRESLQAKYTGEGNPVWRGGRVDNYGPNWQAQRERALERDGYTCQDCGTHADEMERSPDVHHKKRLGWFKEEYDAPEWYERGNQVDNLVTLCPSCHMKREWSAGGLSNS